MKYKYNSNIEGKCPKCGSYLLDYWDQEIDGGFIMYHWICECGCRGIEYYKLEFDGHSVHEDDINDLVDVGVYIKPNEEVKEYKEDTSKQPYIIIDQMEHEVYYFSNAIDMGFALDNILFTREKFGIGYKVNHYNNERIYSIRKA